MKFTYNWLKQYVDVDWSPQELADKLTFAGIEVEQVIELGGQIPAQVVVGQVLASEKHPNADRLSVCRVADGAGERQIVCGAKNYKVGDKIPLALPGAAMAAGFTIKESKLRGVLSQGMMCAAEELGLPAGEDGLLILPPDAPLGAKLTEYLGPGDTVYDIEVTPNRPDWLSVIGIAREIAALSGAALRLPAVELTEIAEASEQLAAVRVEDPDLCPRYTARVIRGVTIGPSPAWLKQALEKVGMRSINNVVDITNYVLLETGHPLHAFDYNLLEDHQVVVRRARAGEKFAAIDGSQHELTESMLVIADAARAVALAGIMGGQNSEINDATTDVLLESAWFLPANVRQTSKRTGLTSESSYRFERGADIDGVVWASHRAAQLIQELAGGQVARGIIDVLAKPMARRQVSCRYGQVNRLLGITVPPTRVNQIFSGLGFSSVAADDQACTVEVPTFRVDLEREVDLIEEVCRIHGVDQVPARMQPAAPAVSEFDAHWDAMMVIRRVLAACGFSEAVNQTMVAAQPDALPLQNPLTSDMKVLRAALVPGLLQNLRTNVSRHQYQVRLFEIGRVFAGDGTERLHLAIAATGPRTPHAWEAARRRELLDYYDLKGVLEELGAALSVPLEAAITEVDQATARRLDLRDPVWVAEWGLDDRLLATSVDRSFSELPRYPSVERDIALVVAEDVPHAAILAAIRGEPNNLLERIELFDVFRGGSIPAGQKSMAYALTYRSAERTLTDAEVNTAHEQIKRRLQRDVACELREG